MQTSHRWFTYLVAGWSGYYVMAIELLSGRLLAPNFGNSIYVWGGIITIFMVALSLGYLLGGQLSLVAPSTAKLGCADPASPPRRRCRSCMAGETVLDWIFENVRDPRYASLLASSLLFFVPTAISGMVSPYAVRLLATEPVVHRQVGRALLLRLDVRQRRRYDPHVVLHGALVRDQSDLHRDDRHFARLIGLAALAFRDARVAMLASRASPARLRRGRGAARRGLPPRTRSAAPGALALPQHHRLRGRRASLHGVRTQHVGAAIVRLAVRSRPARIQLRADDDGGALPQPDAEARADPRAWAAARW